MASEILCVPEGKLKEVIFIIRKGLENAENISFDTKYILEQWCKEEEVYLMSLEND